jgi:hypothetical protein
MDVVIPWEVALASPEDSMVEGSALLGIVTLTEEQGPPE